MNEGLCSGCKNSIWCPTWGEWKCKALKRRIYWSKWKYRNYANTSAGLSTCRFYSKRDKDFKKSMCQCDDCLKNEALLDEMEENND